MVREEGLQVQYNSTVVRVDRARGGPVVWVEGEGGTRREDCGFLVWAAPAASLLQVVGGSREERQLLLLLLQVTEVTEEEREVVGGMLATSVWTSLVRS